MRQPTTRASGDCSGSVMPCTSRPGRTTSRLRPSWPAACGHPSSWIGSPTSTRPCSKPRRTSPRRSASSSRNPMRRSSRKSWSCPCAKPPGLETMNQRAVFLDKDGTLVEDVPYNVDPELIRLGAGAAEGLPRLQAAGFRLIVISNQSGVARGLFPEEALTAVHERLRQLLNGLGVQLDGFFYCPHHPQALVPEYAVACSCRKPEPGLILTAACEHGVA